MRKSVFLIVLFLSLKLIGSENPFSKSCLKDEKEVKCKTRRILLPPTICAGHHDLDKSCVKLSSTSSSEKHEEKTPVVVKPRAVEIVSADYISPNSQRTHFVSVLAPWQSQDRPTQDRQTQGLTYEDIEKWRSHIIMPSPEEEADKITSPIEKSNIIMPTVKEPEKQQNSQPSLETAPKKNYFACCFSCFPKSKQ